MKRFLGLLLVALLHSPLASYAQEGANDNNQPQRYKVGDHYKANGLEGVVFEVDASGQHGKIVSMTQSEPLCWCGDAYEDGVYWGADDRYDGAKNCALILQKNQTQEGAALSSHPLVSAVGRGVVSACRAGVSILDAQRGGTHRRKQNVDRTRRHTPCYTG